MHIFYANEIQGNILPDDDYSVAALLDPALSFSVADASEDNVKALLAKANVLLQCAAKLDTERISGESKLASYSR